MSVALTTRPCTTDHPRLDMPTLSVVIPDNDEMASAYVTVRKLSTKAEMGSVGE